MKGGAALATVVACLSAVVLGASSAAADSASLFAGPGQRPGPSILYKRPQLAPQLTNTGPWRAKPILISGASAYRDGEFLYQDFLYDDHGARLKKGEGRSLPGGASGTYSYPTASKYANNAADLVELRVKPLASATAFRLTFNTLSKPELTAATIAIGSSSSPRAFPHGANASAPAQLFLTWHGNTADLIDAASGDPVSTDVGVKIDFRRRQVQLSLPHSAFDPGRSTVRLAAAAGLWDRANDRYLVPGANSTATRPGGAGDSAKPTAFFNVAFRSAEPLPFAASWRDQLQGAELADGDLSRFFAQIDFDRLAKGVNDDLAGRPEGVPRTGQMNRILSSRFKNGTGGTDFARTCDTCGGEVLGRLQPYTLYVPAKAPTDGRYQLTLQLHSLGQNYNQYSNSRNQMQFGDRPRPSLVITPEGRGPDRFYNDIAGADTFEVWADVAARYPLDPRRTTITGYSMGGLGTFQLATKFPDLFARAQPTVGALIYPVEQLASVRWVPFLMWNADQDELVPPSLFQPNADKLAALGYRYERDEYVPIPGGYHHVMLAINDQYAPAARFLDSSRVVRNPPRVTFVRNPAVDYPRVGTTADHAYWVSRIKLRDTGKLGTLDIRSRGFGRGDPKAVASTGSGVLKGGRLGPRPFAIQRTRWRPEPRIAVRDQLDVTATNVSSVTVDATRARVTCGAKLDVTSDEPVDVRLRNCPAVARAGTSR